MYYCQYPILNVQWTFDAIINLLCSFTFLLITQMACVKFFLEINNYHRLQVYDIYCYHYCFWIVHSILTPLIIILYNRNHEYRCFKCKMQKITETNWNFIARNFIRLLFFFFDTSFATLWKYLTHLFMLSYLFVRPQILLVLV